MSENKTKPKLTSYLPIEERKTKLRQFLDSLNEKPTELDDLFIEVASQIPIKDNGKYDFKNFFDSLPKIKGVVDLEALEDKYGTNKLMIIRPDIFLQIEKKNNIGVLLKQLNKSGTVKVFFTCQNHTTCNIHVWDDTITHRTRENRNCAFCRGRRICICNSLAGKFPEIAKDWDYNSPLNKDLSPDKISYGSKKKVGWICRSERNCGHHNYESLICNRTNGEDRGCSFCAGKCICPCQSLESLYPHVAKEWDYNCEENKGITPKEVAPYSGIRRGWVCLIPECKYEWITTPAKRTKERNNCPKCSNHVKLTDDEIRIRYEQTGFKYLGLPGEYKNNQIPYPVECIAKGHKTKKRLCDTRSGCLKCYEEDKSSRGVKAIIAWLQEHKVDYSQERSLPLLPRRRYDFLIEKLNIIIEFDGMQHFLFNQSWYKDMEVFLFRQDIDRLKTFVAVYSGYTIIRIHNPDPANIDKMLSSNLIVRDKATFINDSTERYKHFGQEIKRSTLEKVCPTLLPHT